MFAYHCCAVCIYFKVHRYASYVGNGDAKRKQWACCEEEEEEEENKPK